MNLSLALLLSPGDLWLPIALIAAGLVLICLKTIASQIEHETKWHDLSVEARAMRLKQTQRLQSLGLKVKR